MADAARRLRRNGLAGGAMALLILALAPPTAGVHGFAGPLAWWLLLALCLVSLAFSVHLLFDAALFRLGASHDAEDVGLAAIDDVLSRTGLRAPGGVAKTLPERLAGCARLLRLQRISLLTGLALYVILILGAMNGDGVRLVSP
ncbi:hypothetical protein [Paracoccus methylarcula]|nr:hypothetical protein [Paracoccus methylarcula]